MRTPTGPKYILQNYMDPLGLGIIHDPTSRVQRLVASDAVDLTNHRCFLVPVLHAKST